MPLLIPLLFGASTLVGGMFIGSQIDDGIESAASKPVTIVQDQSKMPWYVTLAIWAVIAFLAYNFITKKVLK